MCSILIGSLVKSRDSFYPTYFGKTLLQQQPFAYRNFATNFKTVQSVGVKPRINHTTLIQWLKSCWTDWPAQAGSNWKAGRGKSMQLKFLLLYRIHVTYRRIQWQKCRWVLRLHLSRDQSQWKRPDSNFEENCTIDSLAKTDPYFWVTGLHNGGKWLFRACHDIFNF